MSIVTYTQSVSRNILPLSIADTLPGAFGEWHFTGVSEDYGEPIETCKLCEQDGLRYHFEIQNEFNHNTLLVGSHCILQFDVGIYEGGRRLTVDEARKFLQKLTQKMRLESCIRALEKLARAENNDILVNALSYYRTNKKLTPKQAFVVFWRLRTNQIDHDPSFFAITLKKDRYVDDLRNMPTERVHYFWKALSSGQRRKAMELGHIAP